MSNFDDIAKLITENWELLAASTVIFGGIIGAVAKGTPGVLIKQWQNRQQQQRIRQIPAGDFPFDVISPRSTDLLKQIMGGDDKNPLADYKIPYQERQRDRSIRQELEQAFTEKNWVLILGKSGLGKTREAAHLADVMNQEGWTVLKLADQPGEWLDVPKVFPSEISKDDKLLFFLDDLNRWAYAGNPNEIHPKAGEDLARPLCEPVQERLPRLLQYFENQCKSVRVIATARDEQEPDKLGQMSPWDKLQWEKYRAFWDDFTPYELVEPDENALVQLLTDCVAAAGLRGMPQEYEQIVRRNDGTFRNITANLDSAFNRGLIVNDQEFSPRLDATWRLRYNRAVQLYPLAAYGYDAVELLQTLDLYVTEPMLVETTKLFLSGQGLGMWRRGWQLRRALRYLIETEQIQQPKDGQIQGKKTSPVAIHQYVPAILRLLHQMERRYPTDLLAFEFLDCGHALFRLNLIEDALTSFDHALQLEPSSYPEAWSYRGLLLHQLKRAQEALFSFDQAVRLKPDDPSAWYDRGNVLFDLECYEEASDSFKEVVRLDPDYQENWNNWGASLGNLGHHGEALEILEKNVEIDPDGLESLFNLGCALDGTEQYEKALSIFNKIVTINPDHHLACQQQCSILLKLERYEDALDILEQIVKANPNDPEAWSNRGAVLGRLERYEDALYSYSQVEQITPGHPRTSLNQGFTLFQLERHGEAIISFDIALRINPHDYETWYYRGVALGNLKRHEEAITSYGHSLELNWDNPDAFYNQACCYALVGNAKLAVESLQRAIQLAPDECYEMAIVDIDFDTIRSTPQFQALMIPND